MLAPVVGKGALVTVSEGVELTQKHRLMTDSDTDLMVSVWSLKPV
ncbi:MAG: hypothetical protein ABI418_00085 [Jatrophihabitantaceae bacterium]